MTTQPILFRKLKDPYGIFSNFYRTPLTFNGELYQTSEAAYQAQKFIHAPDVMRQIQAAAKPREALEIGQNRTNNMRADWELFIDPVVNKVYPGIEVGPNTIEKVKDLAMFDVLCHKAFCNKEFRDTLTSTDNTEICELSGDDEYWGIGNSGKGVNRLGKVLMLLRTELNKNQYEMEHDRKLNTIVINKIGVSPKTQSVNLFSFSKSFIEYFENDTGCKITFADGFGMTQFNEVRFQLPVHVNLLLWNLL